MTINEYLEAEGLTHAELADLLGVTRQTVWTWVRGGAVQRRLWPRLESLGLEFDRVFGARVLVPARALREGKSALDLIPRRLPYGVEVLL